MNTKTLIATAALVASISFTAGAAQTTVSDFAGLSKAISTASSGDEIILNEGLYEVTNEITITKSVTITGAGKGLTILDGGSTAEPARANSTCTRLTSRFPA